jgi:hypothetical protein
MVLLCGGMEFLVAQAFCQADKEYDQAHEQESAHEKSCSVIAQGVCHFQGNIRG